MALTFDREALWRGALVAAAVSIPAGLVGELLVGGDEDPSTAKTWLGVCFGLLVIAGLVLGAREAARRQLLGYPLAHGIVAAGIVFVAVQSLGLVLDAVADEPTTWSRVVSNLLLTVLAGTVGGVLGSRAGRPGEEG